MKEVAVPDVDPHVLIVVGVEAAAAAGRFIPAEKHQTMRIKPA